MDNADIDCSFDRRDIPVLIFLALPAPDSESVGYS
jgi:hypothetical protein